MLKHLNVNIKNPSRVVVLGANGFVASHVIRCLSSENIPVLGLSKKQVNLLEKESETALQSLLKPEDALVIVSALAPCKNNAMLLDNLRMMQHLCTALEGKKLSQIIYISSDAVYEDDTNPIMESSSCSPSTLHGIMHKTRELMLSCTVRETPIAILRCSLLYGLADPHNGYGPNRFRRLVEEKKTITLFGEGEEKRDHVFIEDVAKIVCLTLQHRSQGILNIATGESYSFREVAEMIVKNGGGSVTIQGTPRQNPISHRHFDITNCRSAFPRFRYTSFREGVA